MTRHFEGGIGALEQLAAQAGTAGFEIEFWDQSIHRVGPPERLAFKIKLNSEEALASLFFMPSAVRVGESFERGEWEVEGDFQAVFETADLILNLEPSLRDIFNLSRSFFPGSHFWIHLLKRATANLSPSDWRVGPNSIGRHYDLDPDFYRWLGATRAYTSGYFRRPSSTLDEAQSDKFDLVCSKLNLRPGDRLFDLGCGWGGLAIHAARHYGAIVVGVTHSPSQARFASEAAIDAGVATKCKFLVCDYRAVNEPEQFDKIASIEAFESVRPRQLTAYFRHLNRLLKPGGLLLNQGVAAVEPPRKSILTSGKSYVEKHVFPNHTPHRLGKFTAAAECAGFISYPSEDLGDHYTRTLEWWTQNFRQCEAQLLGRYDPNSTRRFRIYLERALNSYAAGRLTVYQSIFRKPSQSGSVWKPLISSEIWSETPTDSAIITFERK